MTLNAGIPAHAAASADKKVDIIRDELAVLHTYVHRFVGMRFTVFAGTVTLLSICATMATNARELTSKIFIGILLIGVVILLVAMLCGITRAIWACCTYAVIIEKELNRIGPQHRWVAVNSYNSGYSTNHAIYRGMQILLALVWTMVSSWISHHIYSHDLDVPAMGIAIGAPLMLLAVAASFVYLHFGLCPPRVVRKVVSDTRKLNLLLKHDFHGSGRTSSMPISTEILRWMRSQ